MLNIPHYGKYNGEKRIALPDNSTVSFMYVDISKNINDMENHLTNLRRICNRKR